MQKKARVRALGTDAQETRSIDSLADLYEVAGVSDWDGLVSLVRARTNPTAALAPLVYAVVGGQVWVSWSALDPQTQPERVNGVRITVRHDNQEVWSDCLFGEDYAASWWCLLAALRKVGKEGT